MYHDGWMCPQRLRYRRQQRCLYCVEGGVRSRLNPMNGDHEDGRASAINSVGPCEIVDVPTDALEQRANEHSRA